MFECEANLAALKKKYYEKFNAILPAFTTKFFQVEHRIDLMMYMRVESPAATRSAAERWAEVNTTVSRGVTIGKPKAHPLLQRYGNCPYIGCATYQAGIWAIYSTNL